MQALATTLASIAAAAQTDDGTKPARPDPDSAPDTRASGVEVRLPELLEFVQAPYPKEAQESGRQGDVVLALTIDAEGAVTAAEVVEPAGHGFDEAAREAALQFRFMPATRAGVPVPVRILYRYRFELRFEEPEDQPPPATTGNLEGTLRIAGVGTPLAGAVVTIASEGRPERTMVSDREGRFVFENAVPGEYALTAAAAGFEPFAVTETVVSGEATVVTYELGATAEELEIVVRGERPRREVTRRTLTREQLRRIPGSSGDALLGIQSLPGVARPPGLSGLLIVRGSSPQDTEVFIDGAGAQGIYHFGGLRSVVPTELLDRIDFYPGNFSARYGRVMGGIVDVGLRAPDDLCTAPYMKPLDVEKHGCLHGLAQVDLIDGRALLQGAIAKDWTFAVGARRSWLDAWITPVLESVGAGVTTAPVYYDYQAIVEHTPGRNSRLSLRLLGSDDRIKLLLDEPFGNDPGFSGNVTYGQAFYKFQALYETKLRRSVELRSSLAAGRSTLGFGIGTLRFSLENYPVEMRNEFGWAITDDVKLNTGMDFLVGSASVSARSPAVPDPGQPDAGPVSSRPTIERRTKTTVFRPAWYGELELQATHRLQLVPAARVDYARDSGQADLSPRLSARYQLVSKSDPLSTEGFLATALKAGVGLYHQPPQFSETDAAFGTPGLISNEAVHYAVGVEQEFTDEVELSTEGFYKDMSDLVVSVAEAGRSRLANVGTGYTLGLETLLRYKPGGSFFGWIAYTLSHSVRTDAAGNDRLFEYDEPHNLSALGSYDLGRGWNVGARFRLVSGRLSTPVVRQPNLPAVYSANSSAYAPLQGELNSRRLPLNHQLDVRIEKTWQFELWRLIGYLDVWNVYVNPAVEGVAYNYDYSRETESTGVPILPSLGLQGEF